MAWKKKCDKFILNFLRTSTSILLFAMFIVVMLGVIFRYAMSSPAFWTDELSRYLMFYMVMLGSSIAIREGRHPSLRFVIENFPKKLLKVWELLIHIIVLGVLVVILIKGWQMAIDSTIMKSPAMRIPFTWVYFGLPLGSAFMILETLITMGLMLKKKEGETR